MGKPRKVKNKYLYHVDRKKLWRKKRKLPAIQCPQLKNAWDARKTINDNFAEMGLSSNPNRTIAIPKPRKAMEVRQIDEIETDATAEQLSEPMKSFVADDLEEEASLKPKRLWSLSKPTRMFCTYMLDKYGDDYKAMARDPKNVYQETPKTIKKKIQQFKSMPEVYNEYLEGKRKVGEAVQELEAT